MNLCYFGALNELSIGLGAYLFSDAICLAKTRNFRVFDYSFWVLVFRVSSNSVGIFCIDKNPQLGISKLIGDMNYLPQPKGVC